MPGQSGLKSAAPSAQELAMFREIAILVCGFSDERLVARVWAYLKSVVGLKSTPVFKHGDFGLHPVEP